MTEANRESSAAPRDRSDDAAREAERPYAELDAPPDVGAKHVGSVAVIEDDEGRVLLVRQN